MEVVHEKTQDARDYLPHPILSEVLQLFSLMERSAKMGRGIETSKGGCSDSGYLGGWERSSHEAPTTENGHMSTEDLDSQSSDYNGIDINVPRREYAMGKKFKTIELAEEYYMSYAKAIGFSMRNDILVHNMKEKVSRRRWCCSKEGSRNEKFNKVPNRIRLPKPITRENCPTLYLVGYEKS
ncbi:hypothetical protein ACE6H2_015816 [Prunus campanulata]